MAGKLGDSVAHQQRSVKPTKVSRLKAMAILVVKFLKTNAKFIDVTTNLSIFKGYFYIF